MLKVGIIGAGAISERHIMWYNANKECEIKAIADLNDVQLKKRAEEFNIKNTYSNYRDLLKDEEIDAVSIVTPTFTHKEIIIEALKSGKHVLCEKPPALNSEETKECVEVANECGKLLMFGLVCRFRSQMQYMKKYIQDGKMGKIVCAEAVRTNQCSTTKGWLLNKEKAGGGPLMDAAIHELDSILYLMGYPKVKSVTGFTSDMNSDLPERVQGITSGYRSSDTGKVIRKVESLAYGCIIFENNPYLSIKTSTVLNTITPGTFFEVSGEKAGVRMELFVPEKEIELIECNEYNYLQKTVPMIDTVNMFEAEINHFVDCVVNSVECIVKTDEAIKLMQIIDAIYMSAQTGKTIYFD